MYERKRALAGGREERILVVCSFSAEEFSYRLPKSYRAAKAELLLDNYIPEKEMPCAVCGEWELRKKRGGLPGTAANC